MSGSPFNDRRMGKTIRTITDIPVRGMKTLASPIKEIEKRISPKKERSTDLFSSRKTAPDIPTQLIESHKGQIKRKGIGLPKITHGPSKENIKIDIQIIVQKLAELFSNVQYKIWKMNFLAEAGFSRIYRCDITGKSSEKYYLIRITELIPRITRLTPGRVGMEKSEEEIEEYIAKRETIQKEFFIRRPIPSKRNCLKSQCMPNIACTLCSYHQDVKGIVYLIEFMDLYDGTLDDFVYEFKYDTAYMIPGSNYSGEPAYVNIVDRIKTDWNMVNNFIFIEKEVTEGLDSLHLNINAHGLAKPLAHTELRPGNIFYKGTTHEIKYVSLANFDTICDSTQLSCEGSSMPMFRPRILSEKDSDSKSINYSHVYNNITSDKYAMSLSIILMWFGLSRFLFILIKTMMRLGLLDITMSLDSFVATHFFASPIKTNDGKDEKVIDRESDGYINFWSVFNNLMLIFGGISGPEKRLAGEFKGMMEDELDDDIKQIVDHYGLTGTNKSKLNDELYKRVMIKHINQFFDIGSGANANNTVNIKKIIDQIVKNSETKT